MKRVLLLSSVCFSLLFSGFALEIGERAPGLMVSQWIKNGPVDLYPRKGSKEKPLKADYYVIFFFATWANISQDTIGFVDSLVTIFKESDIKFIGISSENAQRVKKFFEKYPNTEICVGVDDRNRTTNEYLSGNDSIPRFYVFDSRKKLLWQGEPFEINRVLVNIVGGTYDAEKQLEVEKLHQDIRTKIQSLDREGQFKTADEILKIDPTDRVALEYKIDDLIRQDKLDECITLLRNARRSASSNNYIQFYLYNLELDIAMGMIDAKGKKYIQELSSDFYNTFQNSPTALNSMSFRLIQFVPFQITSLDNAYKMIDQAVTIYRKIKPDSPDMASYLQTDARCTYMLGDIDGAISLQKEAISILKEQTELEVATLALDYYQSAQELSEKVKK